MEPSVHDRYELDALASRDQLLARADLYRQATMGAPPGPPKPFLSVEELADPAAAEDRFGMPCAVLSLGNAILNHLAPDKRAVFPHRWISAFSPHSDLSRVASAMIVWMLTDPVTGALVVAKDTDVRSALEIVADAHERLLAGEVLSRKDWAAVRQATLHDVEPDQRSRLDSIAASCAECAAWSPATSGTVTPQTLQRWALVTDGIVDRAHGWTRADYEKLQSARSKVWAATKGDRDASRSVDMDALFFAEAPDIAARWTPIPPERRTLMAARMDACADRFIALLQVAPIADKSKERFDA